MLLLYARHTSDVKHDPEIRSIVERHNHVIVSEWNELPDPAGRACTGTRECLEIIEGDIQRLEFTPQGCTTDP